MFGSGAMTNSVACIEQTKALLVIGSNTTENHPVIALRMKKAVQNGARLIVADPRRIPLVKHAHLWLRHRPGTDTALINAIIHVILAEGLEDRIFIKEHTKNFQALKESVAPFTPAEGERITGVPAEKIIQAARTYAGAERAGIYYTMGITQHTHGTGNVMALGNLALVTGNLGKPGAGINPLRGQNNVQGACDMGCSPDVLPGYQKIGNTILREKFEEAWGWPIPDKPGLTATEMIQAMAEGRLRGLYVMGENPLLSDPNLAHARMAFDKLDFLMVQDIFLTETAELADVVLPAASFAEKDGTFTNTERRVQRVRKAVEPPGQALDDLTIINRLTTRMMGRHLHRPAKGGGECAATNGDLDVYCYTPAMAFQEITSLWPQMAGITYERLNRSGIQWPCPRYDHPGTPYLFAQGFPVGRPAFVPVPYVPSSETPDEDYPLLLTTGRILFQYHTGTMTRRSVPLEKVAPAPFVEIAEDDAREYGVRDGEQITVESRRGKISLTARVGDRVGPGVVFIPFHYKEAAANLLTNDALDPVCKIAEAKVCAVRLLP